MKNQSNISEYEHKLWGTWLGAEIRMVFEPLPEKGIVKFSSPVGGPPKMMDYLIHEVDGEVWLKLQNNARERNYKIIHLDAVSLDIMDSNGTKIRLERASWA